MQKPISPFAISACMLVAACGSSTESNLAPVAYSGKYSDIREVPDLSVYANKAALSAVATSGEYKDLLNTPDLSVYSKTDALSEVALSGAYQDLSGAPELSAVALSGSYNDLAGTPDLSVFATKAGLSLVGVSGDYNDLVNSPDLSVYAPIAGLSAVAFSGNYNSLSGVPDLSIFATKDSLPAYATKDSLSTVATSGSYSDLKNLPDLNQYATKSSLSVSAVSGDYEDLINLPDLSVYAPVASLAKVATTGSYADLSGTPDLSPYATTASLADYAKVSSLADYATNASLSNYATNASLSNYAKSSDLAAVATTGRYQDLSGLLWTGDSNQIVTHAGVTIDVTDRAAFSIISRDSNAVTDQSSSQSDTVYDGTESWQSFTAGVTGKLSAIAVNRWWTSPETGYTLTIYAGDGTGGSVLYSDSNVTVGSGLQTIPLSGGVNLVSGQVYTWRLTNSSSFTLVGYNWSSYSRGRGNWYPTADDQDYVFATYVQPATNSVTVASTGKVGIGTTTPTTMLDVDGDFRIRTPRSPASNDPCEVGQMAWDGSYVYVCVSTNHWRRSGLADY
jgi:hypothetical protein